MANRAGQKLDLDKLKTLMDFFPIGKKLSYCPEFKKEIVFDTILVGYCVNGSFVYSGESVDRDSEGYPSMFRSGEDEERMPVARVKLFQLLVPDTTDLESKLDYQRRALIGRGRQFIKGNSISLISKAGTRGVSTVDTEVAKQVLLKDGPYANTRMILLTPELDTLLVTDQRKQARAKTCVPVRVSFLDDNLSAIYTISDMSDGAVRIRVRDRDTTMPVMNRGDEVMLDIDLGEAERRYTIKGVVFRRSADTCIITLEGLFSEGKLSAFSPLDSLALKAGLLNYGE